MKKRNLFRNDRTTARDELALFILAVSVLTAAVLIILFQEHILQIIRTHAIAAAAVMLLFSVMLFAVIIYRLMDNDRRGK